MKSLRRNIIALFLLVMGVVAWLSPNFIISADTTNPVISIVKPPSQDANSSGAGYIFSTVEEINNDLWKRDIFVSKQLKDGNEGTLYDPFLTCEYTNDCVNIEVNMSKYKDLGSKCKQDIMQVALDRIYNSHISKTNRNKIYNELCSLDETTSSLVRQLSNDVTADFAKAYTYFLPFSGPIGIILGFVSLLMFALLGLTAVIDIAYIVIPAFQFALSNANGDKPKFVSLEAHNAVKAAESKSGNEYVNPMSVYLKSKTRQYIAIFICLLYLVSGQIYSLLADFMDYFRGVLG